VVETVISGPGSGYQSFVIRVFVDDARQFNHGEVLHVSSRSRLRFNEWSEAMDFMTTFSDSGETALHGFSEVPYFLRQPSFAESGAAPSAPGRANGHPMRAQVTARTQEAARIAARPEREKRVQAAMKRGLDVTVSSVALLFLLIPMLIIAMAIKLDSPGPVIYRQPRVGRGGRPFTMYKFRSMVADADDLMPALAEMNENTLPIFKIRRDPRKTRVGRLLRRLSIDELPQIFNVLKGDLSLVGPRPPLEREIAAYEPRHWRRLSVPQGMTGLWQVSGRSLLNFDEMLDLDLAYIERWTIWLDLVLLMKTVPAVLSGRGAF